VGLVERQDKSQAALVFLTEKDYFKKEMIRVRLAPSPTGPLHLGTARTALFNFLFARHNQGRFILRFEDTDRSRSTLASEEEILEGLHWLGLDWDEGPFRQTERLPLYQEFAQKLLKNGQAYLCYCTPKELEEERQRQRQRGKPPRYNGRCRNLTKKKIEQFEAEGRRPAVRFRVPPISLSFSDLIHGLIHFDLKLEGDFVILRSDGIPTFHLAVVVDDALMKISHVIRGEDHLPNTPKQILLQKALGFPQPQYAHLPLILNPDKTKMSKRAGAVEVSEYRKMGYLPEAMVNYLALLGWTPKKEILSLSELVKEFSLDALQKSPAIFYRQKLDWLNGAWIRRLGVKEMTKRIQAFGYPQVNEAMVEIIYERIKRLDEVPFWTDFFFKKIDYSLTELVPAGLSQKEVKEILSAFSKELQGVAWQKEELKNKAFALAQKMNLKMKDLLVPVRVALTGRSISPPLFESMEILGQKESMARISEALQKLNGGESGKN